MFFSKTRLVYLATTSVTVATLLCSCRINAAIALYFTFAYPSDYTESSSSLHQSRRHKTFTNVFIVASEEIEICSSYMKIQHHPLTQPAHIFSETVSIILCMFLVFNNTHNRVHIYSCCCHNLHSFTRNKV